MTIMPVPSPFLSSATAETLPSEFSGKSHCSDGSPFLIDEDSFFYAIDPPPLPPLFIASPSAEFRAAEIEPLLRELFAGVA
jgi:hypothetical protein